MGKYSIKITYTTQVDSKGTLTVISVNGEATNENLKLFAQKLIGLTNNTYVGTTKVTEEAIL